MIPCENSEQQWFECSACGAAMDGDEIDSIQPSTTARRQPGTAREPERGVMYPESCLASCAIGSTVSFRQDCVAVSGKAISDLDRAVRP
jgi:hypothetical protein